MSARNRYRSSGNNRSFLGELLFWAVLLGLDEGRIYL